MEMQNVYHAVVHQYLEEKREFQIRASLDVTTRKQSDEVMVERDTVSSPC